jgi:hypothetical protein
MVKLLVVVVSCKKHSHLWNTILNRNVENLVILCGGSEETKLIDNILHLKCSDEYDGLSEKMMKALEYIMSCDNFKDITHILKADDHDTEFTSDQIKEIVINHKDVLETKDYIGQNVISIPILLGRDHHFDKVSKDSIWYNKPYVKDFSPFCGGGETYILSRKAMGYLILHLNEYTQYILEDAMIGLLLRKHFIRPHQLDYGIKTWKG